MRAAQRLAWLGLTPDPERELPRVAATLRAGAVPSAAALAAERRRVERLILRGSERSWLRYLAEVGALTRRVAGGAPGDPVAAIVAAEVLLDHHRLLIGLPGPAYHAMEADRLALEAALPRLLAASA